MESLSSATLANNNINFTPGICHPKPKNLNIDENAKTQFSRSMKVETLIQELKEKGCLVALTKLPDCYIDQPFQLENKKWNHVLFGFKPNAKKNTFVKNGYAIVLGAETNEGKEYVYFTRSVDITSNKYSFVRTHVPSTVDGKVYVASFKNFHGNLIDLYPPVETHSNINLTAYPKDQPVLSTSEQDYVIELTKLDLKSILDNGAGEKKCKEIGQKIFDYYKDINGMDSFSGKTAMQTICDAIRFIAVDGKTRKQYIEYAWDGIGDENWRWHH